MKKKAKKKNSDEKKKNLAELLKKHGAQIYDDLDKGNFPKFSIPSRSVSNIVYDKKIRQYILGANTAVRSSRNTSQLRSFTQLMWLAFFANRLTGDKKSSTLRDVYYSSQAFAVDFEDQAESDNIIVDLEAVLSSPRESFHVFPEERSSVRTLLKRLHDELSLPVVILTDGDVYGEHIAMVIKSGSANAAHLRELTVPDAKWVGVWATDIEKYKLPTIPMTESDIKRCYDLQKDPRYQEGIWKKELEVFLKIKRKAELEAFSKYGLTNFILFDPSIATSFEKPPEPLMYNIPSINLTMILSSGPGTSATKTN